MVVKSNTGNLVKVEEDKYILDIGQRDYKENIEIELELNVDNIHSLQSSCGCTTPKLISKNPFKVMVTYDSNRVGTINQWVKIRTSVTKVIKITLTGNVKK